MLLPFLESLPKKRLIIFTSNICRDDLFGDFRGPLFSRCKVHTLDLDLDAAALHVSKIATQENLNGSPLEAYRGLLADCQGNIRAALQHVEMGEMLKCGKSSVLPKTVTSLPGGAIRPCSSLTTNLAENIAASTVSKPRSSPKASKVVKIVAPVHSAGATIEERIAVEKAFGAKFLPASPKTLAHRARLKALEAELRAQAVKVPVVEQSAVVSDCERDAVQACVTLGVDSKVAEKAVKRAGIELPGATVQELTQRALLYAN